MVLLPLLHSVPCPQCCYIPADFRAGARRHIGVGVGWSVTERGLEEGFQDGTQ